MRVAAPMVEPVLGSMSAATRSNRTLVKKSKVQLVVRWAGAARDEQRRAKMHGRLRA